MQKEQSDSERRWSQRARRVVRRRGMYAAIIAGLLVLALGTNAFADIPDNGQVFHGCVLTGESRGFDLFPSSQPGSLRLIDTSRGQQCRPNEQAVTWNQTGPQGPSGPSGPTGPTGPTGPAGTALSAYGYVYVKSTSVYEISYGDSVGWTDLGPMLNVTASPGAANITIGTSGEYRVSWFANVDSSLEATFAVAVNGTVNPSTEVNMDQSIKTGEISGQAILPLTAGDVLTLHNSGTNLVDLAQGAGVQAGLTLERIGPLPPT